MSTAFCRAVLKKAIVPCAVAVKSEGAATSGGSREQAAGSRQQAAGRVALLTHNGSKSNHRSTNMQVYSTVWRHKL